MFGLDPLSRSVAVVEILLLLAIAALIGWLLGRWVRNGRIHTLRSALADKQTHVKSHRRPMAPPAVTPVESVPPPSAPVVVDTTPVVVESQPLRPVVDVSPPPVVEPIRPPVEPEISHSPTVPDLELPNHSAPVVEVSGLDRSGFDRSALNGPGKEMPVMPVVEVPPVGAPIPEVPAFNAPVPRPDDPDLVELSTDLPSLQPTNRSLPNSFLPGNTEAAVLNRIAARADELNFDRIGRATAAEADDLKDIMGIGPFLERKLHSLGIYTYRQIANFTKPDSEQVNEIIEFFPGRIERDDWVSQAKQFHERKHGTRT